MRRPVVNEVKKKRIKFNIDKLAEALQDFEITSDDKQVINERVN